MAIAAVLVAPSQADAFVGEGLVVDAGGQLTKAAETVIKQGKAVPELVTKAGTYGGVSESSGAVRVLQGAKVLPALGAVVSFGVGTVVGSQICNAIGIEGCWYFGSEGADPLTPKYEWIYATDPVELPSGNVLPAYQWRYALDDQGALYQGKATTEDCNNRIYLEVPAGVTGWTFSNSFTDGCNGGEVDPAPLSFWVATRGSMANRTLDYNVADDPEIGNYEYEAPADWPERLAQELQGQEDNAAARLGQGIAAEIPESGVADPYAVYSTVPDCVGGEYATCATQLEELELVPQKTVLDWQSAVPELEPGAVTSLDPSPGSEVETESAVQVEVNPPPEGMPLVVPPIEEGDTYADYVERLAPGWAPSELVLPPQLIDPSVGPDEVSRTSPQPGSRAEPGSEPGIDVYVNPGNAPQPGGGGWTAPTVPAIDPTPLTDVSIGCNMFPFGIFCWIGDGLGNWTSGSGQCPQLSVPIGGSQLEYDGCDFEPAMEIIRPVIVVLSAMSVAWLFAASALGFGGGQDD